MNFLYYLDWFPKLSQSFILNEIYHLCQQGHNVAVFSINKPDESIIHEELRELDLPIYYAESPTPQSIGRTFANSSLITTTLARSSISLDHPRNIVASLYLSLQCMGFVESLQWNPDVVHTHFMRGNKLGATYLADHYNALSSITTHAYDIFTPERDRTFQRVAQRFDNIITISYYNKSYIDYKYNIETPISVIRTGIRPEKFNPSTEPVPNRLLSVCRFVEKKGMKYAIDAVAEVAEEYPEVEYHIVGSGPREEEIRTRINHHDLEDVVSLLDNVSDERLIQEFDEASAFVLPCVIDSNGDRDGIPVVLMEAMAMSTPPISTTVSGIPELIDDGENGQLVDPKNVSRLAGSIQEIISNPGLQDQLGKNARETVKVRYDARQTASELVALSKQAI